MNFGGRLAEFVHRVRLITGILEMRLAISVLEA
jgi:hypothetical protein